MCRRVAANTKQMRAAWNFWKCPHNDGAACKYFDGLDYRRDYGAVIVFFGQGKYGSAEQKAAGMDLTPHPGGRFFVRRRSARTERVPAAPALPLQKRESRPFRAVHFCNLPSGKRRSPARTGDIPCPCKRSTDSNLGANAAETVNSEKSPHFFCGTLLFFLKDDAAGGAFRILAQDLQLITSCN